MIYSGLPADPRSIAAKERMKGLPAAMAHSLAMEAAKGK